MEGRFEPVYQHHSMIVAYCRRRGSRDPEAIAAETMTIAWRRLDELDVLDCLPWLIATARNLLHEEYRAQRRTHPMEPETLATTDPRYEPEFEVESLDPEIDRALASLSPGDREVLLLVAWEDLTPSSAAESLGIRPAAFRVRLHRARRRFKKSLETTPPKGVGAAWAATGTNPVASIFRKDLKVTESEYGLDSFSILEPMTQEKFDALPRRIAERASMHASMARLGSGMRSGQPEGSKRDPEHPAGISAIGQGTASSGTDVTMLVMDDQICTIWSVGSSNCAPLEGIKEGMSVGGSPERSNRRLWRLTGMVTDEVALVRIEGSDLPDMPVQDNVLELRNMEPENVRLIGLDDEGNEVVRTGVPIAGWVGLGE